MIARVILGILACAFLLVALDPTGYIQGQASISVVGQLESGPEYHEAIGAKSFWNAVPIVSGLACLVCVVLFVVSLFNSQSAKATK